MRPPIRNISPARAIKPTGSYALSQRLRKRIEECFGWIKTTGCGRKLRYIGKAKNQLWATLTAVALNLVRMAIIEAQSAA